jgi:transcriptional regulator with XRE-family HTH domain
MDIKKVLGKRIKDLRKAKGLTQEKVAELIGIETKSFSNIETGKVFPIAENLNKIMDVLGVTPFDLFNYEYLAPKEDLLKEMNSAMSEDEELTRIMYKIFKSIK